MDRGLPPGLPPVLLVGCGRMGSALLGGWMAGGLQRSVVLDPAPPGQIAAEGHIVIGDIGELDPDFRPRAVVLAVKPQQAEAAMRAVAPLARGAVVLSIMAGQTLASLARGLPDAAGLVRAMPNTPAAIGAGITVAIAADRTHANDRLLCDRLLAAAGSVAWVEDEALLDPVTAVSGSGPAYVFLLAELLEQAGQAQGLPPDLARRLARETITGAGALLAAQPDADAASLRRAVTSPGGTTEAALAVLMAAGAWPRAVADAVQAATARSRSLAS